jgi:anthranilate phosphoribosyltransferase
VAEALGALGSKHAIVVHSEDGLDEVSPAAPTQVAEWENGVLRQYIFTPEEGGVTRAAEGTLRSDNAQSAVREGLAIIDGIEGPKTDLVVLNAAFALKAADRARTVKEGAELARLLLRNGSVRRKVAEITDFYQQN